MCEIAIFNYGKNISQSFTELDESSYAYNEIKPYIDKHEYRGFFSENWHKENLITLVALQGQVSSKNTSLTTTRGQGTVDLIDFFQRVCDECNNEPCSSARMAIVSGNTHILFDGKYRLSSDKNGRSIIAFNETNDLSVKPDSKYVQNMGSTHFPGTIIGIKFPLQETEVETK